MRLLRIAKIVQFINERIIIDPNGGIERKNLSESYQQWCGEDVDKREFNEIAGELLRSMGAKYRHGMLCGYQGVSWRRKQPVDHRFEKIVELMGDRQLATDYLIDLGLDSHDQLTGDKQ